MPATTGPFRYEYSPNLPEILSDLGVSLIVSTYQAGKLAVFRSRDDQLSLLLRNFEHVMGVALHRDRIAVGTRYHVWFLENDARLAARVNPHKAYDACFCPRRSHVTGRIRIHEIAWGRNPYLREDASNAGDDNRELWIVNTRFSCLCTLDPSYSFVPQWHPHFISRLAGDDRCHLNGMAMRDGLPRYVTVISESNQRQGWRQERENGGCILDVQTNQTLARDLCMPHSPRWHQGRLWALDSGRGRLVTADPQSGHVTPIVEVPGYARGLALHGNYAFIGLSKIRETSTFSPVPLAQVRDQLRCGVWVIDLQSGQQIGWVEFQRSVTEVFDVQLLPERRFPAVIGLSKNTIQQLFSFPEYAAGRALCNSG